MNRELSRDNEIVEFVDVTGKELAELNNLQRKKAISEGNSPMKRTREITPKSAVAFRQVITFGTDAQELIRKLDRETQKKLYLEIAQRLSKEIGSKVLYVSIHRDEQAPHAHVILNKYRPDGSAIYLSRQDLKRFQDIAGQVCSEFGLPITRGTPKEERIAAGEPAHKYLHKSVAELHYSLPKAIEDEEKRLEEIEKDIASREHYLEQLEREIEELEKQRQKRLQDIADKERLIAKALQELEKLKREGQSESEKAQRLQKRVETYERRISNYEKEIAEKDNLIKSKNKELETTNKALDMYSDLLRERKEKVEETEKLKRENKALKRELSCVKEFGKRLAEETAKHAPKAQEVITEVIEAAAEGIESKVIDGMLEAFYAEQEAIYMRA